MMDVERVMMQRDEKLVREYYERRMKTPDDAQKYIDLKKWFEEKWNVRFAEKPELRQGRF